MSLFTESHHSLKSRNLQTYRSLSVVGYLASIFQLLISSLYASFEVFKTPNSNHVNLADLILFSPLNKNIKSSQYFFRFFDFDFVNSSRIYVQTNTPSSFLFFKGKKYISLIPLTSYISLFYYYLVLFPYILLFNPILKSRLSCDPSAIRNIFLYYIINFLIS